MDNLIPILFYIVANGYRVFAISRIMSSCLNKKAGLRTWRRGFLAAYFLINTSAFLFLSIPHVTLLTNVVFVFLITLFYETSLFARLTILICVELIGILTEALTLTLMAEKLSSPIFFAGFSASLSGFSQYLISLLLSYCLPPRNKDMLPLPYVLSIALIPTSSIILSIALMTFISVSNLMPVTFCFIALLLLSPAPIYLYHRLQQDYSRLLSAKLLQQQNALYQKHMETISQAQEDMRILRHDWKGHIAALFDLISKNQNQQALSYIRHLSESSLDAQEEICTGNFAVDTILNNKLQKAKTQHVILQHRLHIPREMTFRPFDLTAILSNLLDNAIDATAAVSDGRDKIVRLSMDFAQNCLYIDVQNPFSGSRYQENGQFRSTHPDQQNHGFGLKSVQRAVEKYNGVFTPYVQDQTFCAEILLFSPKVAPPSPTDLPATAGDALTASSGTAAATAHTHGSSTENIPFPGTDDLVATDSASPQNQSPSVSPKP